jgi:plasmid stabilization system protein ParE
MKSYKIKIDQDALEDIKEATKWYNEQVPGLGSRFQKQLKKQVNSLAKTPNSYTKRYADVRCMLIYKFPFLVHFKVDESTNIVEIFAVLHTSRNPKIWEERRNNNK